MSDDRDIAYAAFGFFFGVWSFFWGFKRLRRKRLIENIPTSTVRGLAMGLVELCGKAESAAPLKSPLTNTECVLYRYEIEEYRSSGKSGHWVTIAAGNSFYAPFWLNDATARIMVFPREAEVILPVDYQFETLWGKAVPANLARFMEDNGIHYKGWLGTRNMRFKEWYIRPQEPVYVLGAARKIKPTDVDYGREVARRLEELKKSPEGMEEADLNKDGKIDAREWRAAVVKLEGGVLEQALKNSQTESPSDVIIGKGDAEATFIISDHSEKEIIRQLGWQCLLGIFGGAALSLALLAYFLFRLNLLSFR